MTLPLENSASRPPARPQQCTSSPARPQQYPGPPARPQQYPGPPAKPQLYPGPLPCPSTAREGPEGTTCIITLQGQWRRTQHLLPWNLCPCLPHSRRLAPHLMPLYLCVPRLIMCTSFLGLCTLSWVLWTSVYLALGRVCLYSYFLWSYIHVWTLPLICVCTF